jgi:hypothetical protein
MPMRSVKDQCCSWGSFMARPRPTAHWIQMNWRRRRCGHARCRNRRLGQQFVVENRPGGGNNIGTEAVVRAAPDGYTLLMVTTTNTINATLYDRLNFDFLRDIAPVAGIIRLPLVMVVNPSVPAKTVPEFTAYAKANPGKINLGSPGIGTPGRDLDDKALGPTCARLINTAMTTFIANIELARRGYRRQCMTLIRSIVETVATVLHLMTDPSALGAFHEGKLRSTKSITQAKNILPGFGSYYGMLSESFVHIGIGHSVLEPLVEYRAGEAPLEVILNDMRLMVWLLFVTAELAFLDTVREPRYWQIVGRKCCSFNPSPREREWAYKFLHTQIAE